MLSLSLSLSVVPSVFLFFHSQFPLESLFVCWRSLRLASKWLKIIRNKCSCARVVLDGLGKRQRCRHSPPAQLWAQYLHAWYRFLFRSLLPVHKQEIYILLIAFFFYLICQRVAAVRLLRWCPNLPHCKDLFFTTGTWISRNNTITCQNDKNVL